MIGVLVLSLIIAMATAKQETAGYDPQTGAVEGGGWKCGAEQGDDVRSFIIRDVQWPKLPTTKGDRVIVPYVLDPTFTPEQRQMILTEMKMFENISCVQWLPRTSAFLKNPIVLPDLRRDYVNFTRAVDPGMCWSFIGRQGRGAQTLKLGDRCFNPRTYPGAIPHEMLHALGFIHEQSRLDRDCYVKLTGSFPARDSNYEKIPAAFLVFPYDQDSIMQYNTRHIRALNGKPMGPRYPAALTELDMMKLNHLYCGGPSYCQHVGEDECRRFMAATERCSQ